MTTETRSSDCYVTFTLLSGKQRLRAVAYGSLHLASYASGFEPRISDGLSCTWATPVHCPEMAAVNYLCDLQNVLLLAG